MWWRVTSGEEGGSEVWWRCLWLVVVARRWVAGEREEEASSFCRGRLTKEQCSPVSRRRKR